MHLFGIYRVIRFKEVLTLKYFSQMSAKKMNGGIINGTEKKSPFLIGVAGGTASGKVNHNVIGIYRNTKNIKFAEYSMLQNYGKTWTS